jgi:TPR repeat protein
MRLRALPLAVLGAALILDACFEQGELPPYAQRGAVDRLSTPPEVLPPPPPPPPGADIADPLHKPWPNEKLRAAQSRAAAGDKAAAWDLAGYYGFTLHDEKREAEWMHRAALLRHPEAERWTAHLIRRGLTGFAAHGATPQDAVEGLLRDSCVEQADSSACYDLAEAHETGYFGAVDPVQARLLLERGAELGNRMCWTRLARRLHDGIGGNADAEAAYYWISLEARCVDPRSISGEETWKLRQMLAATLTLEVLEREWAAVDGYLADYHAGKRQIDSAPFLGSAIPDDERREGERLASRRERAHRSAMRTAKAIR